MCWRMGLESLLAVLISLNSCKTMKVTILLLAAFLLVSCSNSQINSDTTQETNVETSGRAMEQKQPAIVGSESAENAVSGFYNALSMGDGSLAVQFIIPEKQETGSFTAAGMSAYYGGLEQMLKVERIDWVGESQRRVVYSYKEEGKEKCQDIVDVNVAERSAGWFIESIVPRQVCKTESPPPEPINTEPTNQPSAVDMRIKCAQYGQQNYEDTYFDDGSIEFEFYYSPSLDTCLLQREEYGPGTAFAIMMYNMFTKEMRVHYYKGNGEGEGVKCTAAKAMGHDVICATSLEEFNQAKTYLLQ